MQIPADSRKDGNSLSVQQKQTGHDPDRPIYTRMRVRDLPIPLPTGHADGRYCEQLLPSAVFLLGVTFTHFVVCLCVCPPAWAEPIC